MVKGFAPIIDGKAKVLLLGTFPGRESLAKNEYYGNPANRFWDILCEVFGVPHTPTSYDEKRDMLLRNNIALWDIVDECDKKGQSSADGDINWGTAIFNDINSLLNEFSNIKKIFFASRICEEKFNKKIRGGISRKDIVFGLVPSPSGANARFSFKDKVTAWKKALK
jgi:hypoxanthine-DNA glycosylase